MGEFCRNLYLYDRSNTVKKLTDGQLDQFYSSLPNLKKVVIRNNDASNDFIHLARKAALIKNLKELTLAFATYSPVADIPQQYHECAFAFKNTLQQITILEAGASVTGNNGQAGHAYMFLPQFTALTSLCIKNPIRNGLKELSMFQVLHLCPHLTTLQWENDFQEPDFDESGCLFNHSQLQDLTITSLGKMSKQHVGFIIEKITNLKRISLAFGPKRKGSLPQQTYDFDLLNLWQSYFSNIEEKVYFYLNDNSPPKRINYWSFIDSTNGNNYLAKPTHISIVLSHSSYRFTPLTKIRLQKLAPCTAAFFKIDMTELDLWNNGNSQRNLQVSPLLPADLSSQRMVQTYEVQCNPQNELEEQTICTLFSNILLSVLQCFSDLHHVNLICYSWQGDLIPKIKFQATISSNVDDYNQKYQMKSNAPRLITERYSPNSSERLAYVKLKGIQSLEEIGSIVNLLPNTRYITLVESLKRLDQNHNIMLDFGITLNLKQLHLDITTLALRSKGRNTITLQIEELAINRVHYYQWKRRDKKFTEMAFEPVTASFLIEDEHFSSNNHNIVFIKLGRVEQIGLTSLKPTQYIDTIEIFIDLTT